jgi:uncharacterized membrane protein YqjE
MSGHPPGAGLLVSLRRLLSTALEITQVRLELLSVELEQEKQRVVAGLLWASLAVLLLGVGIVLLVGLLLMLLWDGYRLPALALLSLLFLGGGGLLLQRAHARLSSPAGLAVASLGELARDREALERAE